MITNRQHGCSRFGYNFRLFLSLNCLLTLQAVNEMKAHEHIAVVKPRSQLTAVKRPVLRTVKLHVEVFARRFSVFIELSGSKINRSNACDHSALSDTLRTEVVSDLKHHTRLDSLFELRQVLDRRNFRLIGCYLSLFRLRLHGCRLLLFRFSPADILIHTAVQELIIGDILRHSKTAAFSCDSAIVRIER